MLNGWIIYKKISCNSRIDELFDGRLVLISGKNAHPVPSKPAERVNEPLLMSSSYIPFMEFSLPILSTSQYQISRRFHGERGTYIYEGDRAYN